MTRAVDRLLSLYPIGFQEEYRDDIREGIALKIVAGDRRLIRREYVALAARAPGAWLAPLKDVSSVGDLRSWVRIGFIAVFAFFLLIVVGGVDAFGVFAAIGIPLAMAGIYLGWRWLVLLAGLGSAATMFDALLSVEVTSASARWYVVPVCLASLGATVASGRPRLSRDILGPSPRLVTGGFALLGLYQEPGPLFAAVLIVYLYGLWRLPAAAAGMWLASAVLIIPTMSIWQNPLFPILYLAGSGLLVVARVAGDPETKREVSDRVHRFFPWLPRVRSWVVENVLGGSGPN